MEGCSIVERVRMLRGEWVDGQDRTYVLRLAVMVQTGANSLIVVI